MEAMMKKFFDQKLGEFVNVEKDNVQFNFSGGSGQIRLAKADIKSEVFDQLHFPIALRGGFIEDMSCNLDMGVFSSGPAQVNIKNVFLVFGPHKSDWSYQNVYDCKSRLVDLVMKVYELKSSKKKKPVQGGLVANMIKRRIEDIEKKFLGNLEVHISNIHYRYEDATTQDTPFACGFKIGFIGVSSGADPKTLRTTGEWRYTKERCGEYFVSQMITSRRISAYWDVNKDVALVSEKPISAQSLIAAKGPVNGKEVSEFFKRLNLRETFSAGVVDTVLDKFPPDHPRRRYLDGPCFRERLDFHKYVMFPSSLDAHVIANRVDENTMLQKAPLKDADVIFNSLQLAVDSEQVRSMNELLAFKKDFQRKDELFRTRPQRAISSLPGVTASNGKSSSSSSRPQLSPAEQIERTRILRAWWHHALEGVRLMCNIPRSQLDAEELKKKAKLREEYVELALAAAQEKKDAGPDADAYNLPTAKKLREMQMSLPVREILDWRLLARDRQRERQGQPAVQEEEPKEEEEEEAKEPMGSVDKTAEGPPVEKPNTMQVRVQFKAFQSFFLIVADEHWRTVMQSPTAPANLNSKVKPSAKYRGALTRQLVVKAQVSDVRMQAIQKGRSNHRIARWVQLEIGRISAMNCNTKGAKSAARDIINIAPFEHQPGVAPVCVFVGATMFEMKDRNFEKGDVPIAAMLEPWTGLASHAKEFPAVMDDGEQLQQLGFPKDETIGRLMTFGFVRVGQVQALDYTPFRRRLMHFIKRGTNTKPTDLVRRPSPLALDRELLVKLQRRVEKLTGKSNMLGSVEGVLDGVQGRLVDHYNTQNVLCKQVALAPMRWKALRNGSPQTFNLQFHQLLRPGEQQPMLPRLSGDMFGLLPWKVAMLLQPKAEYSMGLDQFPDPAHGKAPSAAVPETAPSSKAPAPAPVQGDVNDTTAVLGGAYFIKWCRNGKPKRRFITFDDRYDAIVWKSSDKVDTILGLIPLAKIQDICTGVHTPVLYKARGSPKFREDRAWSIVSADRTLDLQADTVAQQHRWVTGLEARFKLHVQRQGFDSESKKPLPTTLERLQKTYPDKFKSEQCGLRSKIKKLQAFHEVNAVTEDK